METLKIVNQKPQKKREREPNPFEAGGFAGTVYSMLHDMVCILAVIVVFFFLAARLVGVSGSSMYPTLVGEDRDEHTTGDYLILRSNFLSSTYEQGDIVVACVPTFKNGEPIVKRVIATGGQTVSFHIRMKDSDMQMRVSVDGEEQEDAFINEPMSPFGPPEDGYTVTVPAGCYFLMGDNRNRSADSRDPDIGMVDGRYIVGKAFWLVFPGQDIYDEMKRDLKRIGDIYD